MLSTISRKKKQKQLTPQPTPPIDRLVQLEQQNTKLLESFELLKALMITNTKTRNDNNANDATVTIKNTRARPSAWAGGGDNSENSDSSDSSDNDSSVKGSGPREPQHPSDNLDFNNSTNSSKDDNSNGNKKANTGVGGNGRDKILLSLLRSLNQNQRKTLK